MCSVSSQQKVQQTNESTVSLSRLALPTCESDTFLSRVQVSYNVINMQELVISTWLGLGKDDGLALHRIQIQVQDLCCNSSYGVMCLHVCLHLHSTLYLILTSRCTTVCICKMECPICFLLPSAMMYSHMTSVKAL